MTYEIMTLEQLDAVSGGTWKEYFEIAKLLPSALLESRNELGETYFAKRYMYPKEVEDWLNKKLGIWANIDAGSSFNPSPRSGEKKFLHAKRRKCDAQQSYRRNSQLPRQVRFISKTTLRHTSRGCSFDDRLTLRARFKSVRTVVAPCRS